MGRSTLFLLIAPQIRKEIDSAQQNFKDLHEILFSPKTNSERCNCCKWIPSNANTKCRNFCHWCPYWCTIWKHNLKWFENEGAGFINFMYFLQTDNNVVMNCRLWGILYIFDTLYMPRIYRTWYLNKLFYIKVCFVSLLHFSEISSTFFGILDYTVLLMVKFNSGRCRVISPQKKYYIPSISFVSHFIHWMWGCKRH